MKSRVDELHLSVGWGFMAKPQPKISAYLSKADPTLAKLIKKVGPFKLEPDPKMTLYQSLLRAIVFQQLNGKAASTIYKRFEALYPGRGCPKPLEILASSEDLMRSAGLSRAKTAAIRDLALKASQGEIPSTRHIKKMTETEIIEKLTQVRGIGPWTVEMMLIFKLGRLDVLPSTDFGVRKGFAQAYGRKELPAPRELIAIAEKWRPYRTAAAWYLWRSLD